MAKVDEANVRVLALSGGGEAGRGLFLGCNWECPGTWIASLGTVVLEDDTTGAFEVFCAVSEIMLLTAPGTVDVAVLVRLVLTVRGENDTEFAPGMLPPRV